MWFKQSAPARSPSRPPNGSILGVAWRGSGPVRFHVSGIWTRYRRRENNFTLVYLEEIRKPVLRSGFKPDEGR